MPYRRPANAGRVDDAPAGIAGARAEDRPILPCTIGEEREPISSRLPPRSCPTFARRQQGRVSALVRLARAALAERAIGTLAGTIDRPRVAPYHSPPCPVSRAWLEDSFRVRR